MIDQLIAEIYEATVEMGHRFEADDIDGFEAILAKRQNLMDKVDRLKRDIPNHTYSAESKKTLAAVIQLDQLLFPKIKEKKNQVGTNINQVKKNKQVSKKYMPYQQQNFGAFIDTNK